MKYQQLGKSDLSISTIGFGCMSLKDNQFDNEKIIHQAIELGINYFDTADLYDKGLNEETVGRALKTHRNKVVIATKVGNKWRSDGSGWDWNATKTYILSAVEESLKRLQTDYIDLYQLHGGTLDDPMMETIEAFELLKKQGKIRHYGISSIRPNVIKEYIKHSNIVSVMMQYSLLDRRPEEECLSLLQQENIGVLVRGSVAGGLLVNKPAKAYLNYNAVEVAKAAEAIKELTGPARSAANVCIQYVLQHPAVTAAVVGIRTQDQLKDAVQTLQASPMSDTETATLRSTIPVNIYEQHR